MLTHNDARNNHLLATLPTKEFDHVMSGLERVSLTSGRVLHGSGEKFEYVYFPTTAVITLLYITESGTTVGVGMIGNEGVLGIEIFMGNNSSPSMAIVQNSGTAYRMRAREFRSHCGAVPSCHDTLLRYAQALLTQVSQTAACNRFHSTYQRLARWLLESSDRMDTDRLTMTHEQISASLGTRRENISMAAHKLSVLGLIKINRGQTTILDRPGLEFAACECYEVISAE